MISVRIRTFPDDSASTTPVGDSRAALLLAAGSPLAGLMLADKVATIAATSVLEAALAGPYPASQVRRHLPALVTVELDEDGLEESVLLDLADVLGLLPDVPAALVERDGMPYGIITRADLASALPLELIGDSVERLGNAPALPSRRYICRKCVPPSRRLPRSTAAGAPECSLVWAHGPMELEA
jgi:hypothetical protein